MATLTKLKERLQRGSHLSCHEVRRVLQGLGYVLIRQKGSHEQWVKVGRTFTLPVHGKEAPFYILDALKTLLEEADEE